MNVNWGRLNTGQNPSPKTRKKRKVIVKPEVSNDPKAESKDKGLEEANPPINAGISDDGVGNVVPCYSEVTLNRPPSDKGHSTPAKTEDRLTKNEDINAVNCKNFSEPNNPCKDGKESMHKLYQLA